MARLVDKMNGLFTKQRLQAQRNHLYNLWVEQKISWDELEKRLKEIRKKEREK